jgi:hypothetical protein
VEVARELGKRFNALDAAAKQKLQEEAAAKLAQYEKEKAHFKNTMMPQPTPPNAWIAYFVGRVKELGLKMGHGGMSEAVKRIKPEFDALSDEQKAKNKFFNKDDYDRAMAEREEHNNKVAMRIQNMYNKWKQQQQDKRDSRTGIVTPAVPSS